MLNAAIIAIDRDANNMAKIGLNGEKMTRTVVTKFPVQIKDAHVVGTVPTLFVEDILAIDLTEQFAPQGDWTVFCLIPGGDPIVVEKASKEFSKLVMNERYIKHFEGTYDEAVQISKEIYDTLKDAYGEHYTRKELTILRSTNF